MANDMITQIKSEMKKVYLEDGKPIVVGYSGGKDSSLMLALLWEVLKSIPLENRTKTVHIMTSDTKVEVPAISEFIKGTLQKIEHQGKVDQLPIQVHKLEPTLKSSFWFKILGRGTLVPTPESPRWCTSALKISPSRNLLKELIASAPTTIGEEHALTLMLGLRLEESARRAANIRNFEISKNGLFSRHVDFKEIRVMSPIKFIGSDELWFELLNFGRLPFGISVEDLTLQYGEDILECGLKTSTDVGNACGGSGSRIGCWTCGLVSGNDPMLLRFIEEGKPYQGLLDWKNLMLNMRNDIRYRELMRRQTYNKKVNEYELDKGKIDLFDLDDSTKDINRYETFKRAKYDIYEPGSLTVEGRMILLKALLHTQQELGETLISEEEILAILEQWKDTDQIIISRDQINPEPFHYDGQLVFKKERFRKYQIVNYKKTVNPNKIFYVTVELNMEEVEFYQFFKKRQRETLTSLFFFPEAQEFRDKKLVWNKATFVVCKEGIKTQEQAYEYAYKWLGWQYGHFTEETQKAAINHLILSALSEGLTEKQEKQPNKIPNLIESQFEEGQLAFAL
ncbi:phosphoadenosine phosphosulfate reductase domain-containing protein [Bacillus sp. FJAT-29937]|uniref:phosphoadenosine phosphosulfate reductase domain-containing protein n=1 Tax=Bacillus sp. FJAT-29937 TaxID=1720553 RepID=UPI0008318ADE|nr:phosphoadenosine phosphosulfate reductase family protein [Bacillus sp. FJAT-29937]